MTDCEDDVENAVNRLEIQRPSPGGPQSPAAREICRGVVRVLAAHGMTAVAELPLPTGILPDDAGLIIADRYGGEILRPAPEIRLPAPKRKVMTLRMARACASRLSVLLDPTLPAAVGLGISDA